MPKTVIPHSQETDRITKELAELGIDLREELDRYPFPLTVPAETTYAAGLSEEGAYLTLKHYNFSVTISIEMSEWGLGLPDSISDVRNFDLEYEFQRGIGHFIFDLRFQATFNLEDPDSLFVKHYAFVKNIQDVLMHDWNWEIQSRIFREQRIEEIHTKLDQILAILRAKKSRLF